MFLFAASHAALASDHDHANHSSEEVDEHGRKAIKEDERIFRQYIFYVRSGSCISARVIVCATLKIDKRRRREKKNAC